MSKLPYFPFYPGDWLKDPDLRRCDHHTKGVWIDILCLMHQCQVTGVLSTNNVPWSRDDIAAAIGGNAPAVLASIDVIISKGVCSVRADGSLCSRRMILDAENRAKDAQRKSNVRSMSAVCPDDVRTMSADTSYSVSVSPSVANSGGREGAHPPTPQISASGATVNGQSTPTQVEVAEYAATIDLAQWKAIDWWRQMEGAGWISGKQPVRSWRAICDRVKARWEADGRPAQMPGFGAKAEGKSKPSVIDLKNVIEAKKIEADKLKHEFASEVATGTQWNDQNARKEWVKLRGEIKDINHKISTYCD